MFNQKTQSDFGISGILPFGIQRKEHSLMHEFCHYTRHTLSTIYGLWPGEVVGIPNRVVGISDRQLDLESASGRSGEGFSVLHMDASKGG
jgi:hypothetical protein